MGWFYKGYCENELNNYYEAVKRLIIAIIMIISYD